MKLLATTAILALVSGSAMANWPSPPPSSSKSVSNAGASSRSVAGASAGASATNGPINIRNTVKVGSGQGSAGTPATTGAADPSSGAGWGGDNHQFPVAPAYAPSFGTVNPCVGTSASLGAQFQLFGLSAGGQQMDEECRILRLGSPADVEAARNLICIQSSDARTAYYEAGLPCPADRAKYQQALAEQQPVAVMPTASAFPDGDHSAEACPVGLYGAALRARPWCNQDDEP